MFPLGQLDSVFVSLYTCLFVRSVFLCLRMGSVCSYNYLWIYDYFKMKRLTKWYCLSSSFDQAAFSLNNNFRTIYIMNQATADNSRLSVLSSLSVLFGFCFSGLLKKKGNIQVGPDGFLTVEGNLECLKVFWYLHTWKNSVKLLHLSNL